MGIDYLVTHSGGFHADEVLSTAVLKRLHPEATIVRSRDTAWLTPGEDRLIYDVGSAYDAQKGIFDHHQREAPLRPDGKAYSSFGLIWLHFGRDYMAVLGVDPAHADYVFGKFDHDIVLPVDMVDTGALSPSTAGALAPLTFSSIVDSLKPEFDNDDPDAEARGFDEAVALAARLIEARIGKMAAKARAESLVTEAVLAAGDSRVLVLPMGMPYRSVVVKIGADHLLFVVTPRGKDWTIGGIRANDDGFELRADLPAAWGGLSGEDLELASGVSGATFCHKALFLAAANSRPAIMEMADLAVTNAEAAGL